MPRFTKELLRSGRYLKQGQWIKVTKGNIKAAHDSINQLAEKSLQIPLILEHVTPSEGQTEGVPMSLADMKSSQLTRTVGYIAGDSAKLSDDGHTLKCDFEVPDEKTAKQLADKTIRFLSPEFRPKGWTHKKTGDHFEEVISHVALTHTPIQCDQAQDFETIALSDFDGVLCFSAEEMETPVEQDPIQFADHPPFHKDDNTSHDDNGEASNNGPVDGEGGNEIPKPQPENPDMPQGDDTADEAQMQALLAHLGNVGLGMQADTNKENFLDRLLTALLTSEATKASVEKEKKPEVNPEDEQVDEVADESLSMRFSDDDNKNRKALGVRIVTLHEQGKLPSKNRDNLMLQLATTQFSEDGKEIADAMSIGDILQLADSNPGVFGVGSPQTLLKNRITQLSTGPEAKIFPAMAERLFAHIPTLQFSEGEEVASGAGLTLTSILDGFDAQSSQMSILLSDVSGDDWAKLGIEEEEDSRGKGFRDGDPTIRMGDEEAESAVDRLRKSSPEMFRQPVEA